MTLRHRLVSSSLLLLSLAACGSGDQSIDPGTGQNPSTDGGADGNGVVLEVSYEGQSVPLDLGAIATSDYKGVNLVKLSDVWAASRIAADRSELEFRFVGDDGFTPWSKGCADLPGDVLARGYIDPSSRNLTWDETLGFKGCYSVKSTAQMNAHAPTGEADAAAE